MIKTIGGTIPVIMAILVSVAAISCSAPAPKVADIVGVHEWKPLQEGTLICASEDIHGLSYSWSSEKGTIKGDGKQVTWTAPDSAGDYTITVNVTNALGSQTTFRKTFKVTDNPFNNDTPDRTIYLRLSPPATSIVSQKSHSRIWITTEIECVVAGTDESALTYRWTAPTGKLAGIGLADGKAKKVGWIAPGVAGIYKVSVTVTDKSGNKASGEVDMDVYCCKD